MPNFRPDYALGFCFVKNLGIRICIYVFVKCVRGKQVALPRN